VGLGVRPTGTSLMARASGTAKNASSAAQMKVPTGRPSLPVGPTRRRLNVSYAHSLFIDDGFGTLDPETLETVAGAIEALPLGGCMVGIITHVAELAARLPARVVVEKRNDGSRVRVEVN
jgi:hypothetical protein